MIDDLEPVYRRINTTPYIVFHILLTVEFSENHFLISFYVQVGFVVLIVLFPWQICPGPDENISSNRCGNHSGYNIALYIHAGAYLVNLAFDR